MHSSLQDSDQAILLQHSPTPLTDVKLPLVLHWRNGGNMPFTIEANPKLVAIDNNVYIGGGITFNTKRRVVIVYNLRSQLWNELPSYECYCFGMAEINKQLVVIGGISSEGRRSNNLGVWDEKKGSWTHPFPPMPTPRSSPSAVSYDHWLVVAGGNNSARNYLATVEVLNTTIKEWCKATSLPMGCSHTTSAVMGNMWYLLGGDYRESRTRDKCFSVCLDNLIYNAISHTPSESSPWQTLPDTPLRLSSALTVKEHYWQLEDFGMSFSLTQGFISFNLPTRAGSILASYLLKGLIVVAQCSPVGGVHCWWFQQ